GTLALMGLPLIYALVLGEHWLSSRWRRRGKPSAVSARPAPPLPVAAPFRYVGGYWKASVGALAVLAGMIAFAWLLPPSGDSFFDATVGILRWLVLALAAIVIPAAALRFRPMTVEVDERGVRVRGRFRPLDIRWDDVERLEVTQFAGFPFSTSVRAEFPRLYAVWRKTGTVAGTMAPAGELGKREGAALEAAILSYANQHNIRIVDVPWRSTRAWWRMRDRGRPTEAEPPAYKT
ncbi:MAG TPA: PH domain-containing protein, partial [Thermoplasmata archaeon]|nr:PH domain-containing protein [Thermoplasmata archaeon]